MAAIVAATDGAEPVAAGPKPTTIAPPSEALDSLHREMTALACQHKLELPKLPPQPLTHAALSAEWFELRRQLVERHRACLAPMIDIGETCSRIDSLSKQLEQLAGEEELKLAKYAKRAQLAGARSLKNFRAALQNNGAIQKAIEREIWGLAKLQQIKAYGDRLGPRINEWLASTWRLHLQKAINDLAVIGRDADVEIQLQAPVEHPQPLPSPKLAYLEGSLEQIFKRGLSDHPGLAIGAAIGGGAFTIYILCIGAVFAPLFFIREKLVKKARAEMNACLPQALVLARSFYDGRVSERGVGLAERRLRALEARLLAELRRNAEQRLRAIQDEILMLKVRIAAEMEERPTREKALRETVLACSAIGGKLRQLEPPTG